MEIGCRISTIQPRPMLKSDRFGMEIVFYIFWNFLVKLKSDRFGMEIQETWQIGWMLLKKLKSDRFGMEICDKDYLLNQCKK